MTNTKKCPAGTNIYRNFTPNKGCVRDNGGFSSHLRQPARNAQRNVVSTDILSLTGQAALRGMFNDLK
ncbi:MAG: hypothetical protein LBF04_04495 [Prevotellaceae bacterium]|jgi:hypothetical protein|nr:hypothetical protein [Prevotellaceae bacterium]